MTGGNLPPPQGKPQITLNRPSKPGSGIMWAGLVVMILSLLVYVVSSRSTAPEDNVSLDSEAYGVSAAGAVQAATDAADPADQTANASIQGGRNMVASGVLTEEQLQQGVEGTLGAIAAADAAKPVEPGAAQPSDIQLNDVAISLTLGTGWQAAQNGRQWMFVNAEANVMCQLTARSDAEPGGVQKDAAGDEEKYEREFLEQTIPLPGADRTSKLLFRESNNEFYRYGVAVQMTVAGQGRAVSMNFVNALAQRGSHMARVQCAARDMRQGADMASAEVLVQSLRAR